jgi:hypothetical protein
MVIVLVTSGEHESVDYASVNLFDSESDALGFCLKQNTGPQKYWVKAEFVNQCESIELCQPEK